MRCVRLALLVLSSMGAIGAAIACTGGDSASSTPGADGGTPGPGAPGSTTSPDGSTAPSDCASGEAVFALASDGGPYNKHGGVAVDATNVYYATWDGSVWKLPRCAPAGTAPTLVGSTPPSVNSTYYFNAVLAIDGTNAYIASQLGPIVAMPLAGGAVTTLVPVEHVEAIVSDGTHIYYTTLAHDDPDAGAGVSAYISNVFAVPIGGGTPPVALASSAAEGGLKGIAVDSTHVYYAERSDFESTPSHVWAVPLAGGPATSLTTDPLPSPAGLSLVGTTLYVCDQGGAVYSIPTAGGAHSVLAGGINNALAVAVTSTDVYFTNTLINDGWILHRPLAQRGESSTIAFHGNSDYPAFGGLVSFGSSIYFTFNGTAYADDAGADGGAGPMVVRITP